MQNTAGECKARTRAHRKNEESDIPAQVVTVNYAAICCLNSVVGTSYLS